MSSNRLQLEEIEGDRDGTSDFVFFKIGSSVPLKREYSSFDLSRPPGRPLAVSEQYGAIFIVSDGGFMVVKTVDAIAAAKSIKEVEKGDRKRAEIDSLCVQEKSILDVQIGNVHILAVSTDSSILAAIVGGVVHFFLISSLMQKKQEAAFVLSIGGSSGAKDFLWRKNRETSFIVLCDSGQLYHGNMKDDLKSIMDGVEAADWSVEGDFLVVAKHKVLIILSSDYKEKLSMSLAFETWIDNSDSSLTVKVDSVKWVRRDSIVIGCIQVNEDSEETDYMVQVITTKEARFDEASSNATVVTFIDLFRGIVDDIVPPGRGPHLFLSYLKNWELAFVANRKNTDEHVVLLAWSGDDVERPTCLEFEQEKFIPRIDLQESGDDNLLLGIDIDRLSIHEKLEFIADSEVKVLSPQCILVCLSCEGKLIMFHVARLSEPACSPNNLKALAKADFSSVLLSGDDKSIPTDDKLEASAQKLTINNAPTTPESRTVEAAAFSSVAVQKKLVSPIKDTDKEQVPRLPAELGTSMNPLSSVSLLGDQSSEASATVGLRKVFSMNEDEGLTSGPFRSQSADKPGDFDGIKLQSPLLNLSGSTLGYSQGTVRPQRNNTVQGFPGGAASSLKLSQESRFVTPFDQSKVSLKSENIEFASSGRDISIPGNFDISNRFRGIQESEVKLIKQFYSVDDITKELDKLLKDIEQEGGLRDACTVVQRSSVLSLEEGIDKLSEKFWTCKAKVEEQLKEIQRLQDRRMQVTSRQIYMEGLVKQALNGQYWDLWNAQKLGPELEVKQQRISKLNHALVKELVELERHFNALELKKHAESGAYIKGRRSIGETFSSSRQNYSLYTLNNTVNAQLAAAEQLSGCLSTHMGHLKISSPPMKQHSVKRELLESIGLDYDSQSFQSPTQRKDVHSLEWSKQTSVPLLSCRETAVEPESSRRRRDSLDRSWTKFDPPKTTVKRMQVQERSRVVTEKPCSPVKEETGVQVPKYDQKKLALQYPKPQSSSLFHLTKDLPQLSSDGIQSSPLRVDQLADDTSHQFLEPPSSSLFKWTKDLPQVSSGNILSSPLKVSQSAKDISLTSKQPAPSKLEVEPLNNRIAQQVPPVAKLEIESSKTSEWGRMISGSSSVMVAQATHRGDSSLDKSPLSSKQPAPSKVAIELLTSQITQQVPPSSIPSQSALQIKTLQLNDIGHEPSGSSPNIVDLSAKPDNASLGKGFLSSISKEKSVTSKVPPVGMPSTTASFSGQLLPTTMSAAAPTSTVTTLSSPSQSSFSSIPSVTFKITPQAVTLPDTLPESKPQIRSEPVDTMIREEDEMEEEDPEVGSMLSLDGFALGQPSVSSTVANKPSPFGTSTSPAAPLFPTTVPPGQLFRPASFSLPASQPVQTNQPLTSSGFSTSSLTGFGLPAQIGVAQQALGSVLGSFGQSRQLGFSPPAAPAGGFSSSMLSSGGFAATATSAGGFSALAPQGGSGFASFKSSGFAAAAAPSGGFGAFGSSQGTTGGFSSFGSISANDSSKPPASIFTQMRK